MQALLMKRHREAVSHADGLLQAGHFPAVFDDGKRAQNPVLSISRSGRIKLKPPMHRMASDFQKGLQTLLGTDDREPPASTDGWTALSPGTTSD